MSDVFSRLNSPDPLLQDVDKARFVAQEIPGPHEIETVHEQGLPVEKLSIPGGPTLEIKDHLDPDPDVEKVGIRAEIPREGRTLTANVTHTEYSDGDNYASGSVEIRRQRADGTEEVLVSKNPKRAQRVGRIIANQFVDEVNDNSARRRTKLR